MAQRERERYSEREREYSDIMAQRERERYSDRMAERER